MTALSRDERKLLLQWMSAGRRTYSNAERLWARYLQLSGPARAELAEGLIDSL